MSDEIVNRVRNELLSEVGQWHVKGEDPNCDLGGHHHMPSLGHFHGRYAEADDSPLPRILPEISVVKLYEARVGKIP